MVSIGCYHTMKLRVLLILLAVMACERTFAQENSEFDVKLLIDYASAEQVIEIYNEQFVSSGSVAELRGNKIVASTTGMIAAQGRGGYMLESYLDSLKYRQYIQNDLYQIGDAKQNVTAIQNLLDAIKKRNFNRKVVATVEQIFPNDVDVSTRIPVYMVALGHGNVDAFVQRIVWNDNTPSFVGDDKGELTIVVNLAHAIKYSDNLEEQYIQLLGVVAHEVFHAAFGVYKEGSRTWDLFSRTHHRPFDYLLDLTQNEGIAYYLSIDQELKDYRPMDWGSRMRDVFIKFNTNGKELLSSVITNARTNELIRNANLSGFWESYGAMAGMHIARAIDKGLGRAALIETISNGPFDFFRKYIELTEQDGGLLKLNREIVEAVRKG